MKTNMYGQAILNSDELKELLLRGRNISNLTVEQDEDLELYNEHYDSLLKQHVTFLFPDKEIYTFDEFHKNSADKWLFPVEFQQLDVYTWLLNKCKTQEEIDRVIEEYTLYEERDLIMLLRLFIFLIDYMRKNKFIWGVGRGSSVSSYILYLIGVHRVNSLKYNFSISDFLK